MNAEGYLSVCLSVYQLYVCLSIFLFISYISIYPSVCVYVCVTMIIEVINLRVIGMGMSEGEVRGI